MEYFLDGAWFSNRDEARRFSAQNCGALVALSLCVEIYRIVSLL
jgi:hypothetical protein